MSRGNVVWETTLLEHHPDRAVQRELSLGRITIDEGSKELRGDTHMMSWTSSPIGPRDFKATLFFTGSRFNSFIALGVGLHNTVDLQRKVHDDPSCFVVGLGGRAVSVGGIVRGGARANGPEKIPAGSEVELWKDGGRLYFRAQQPGSFETERELIIADLPDTRIGRWCLVAATGTEASRVVIVGVEPLQRWWTRGTHHRHSQELRQCVETLVHALHRGRMVTSGSRALAAETLQQFPPEVTAIICGQLAAADFYL